MRLAVVLLGILGSTAQELCLDDGVPESQRVYIQERGWVKAWNFDWYVELGIRNP